MRWESVERDRRIGMEYAIIGTWRMALEGVSRAAARLGEDAAAGEAVKTAVSDVEDNPDYMSVGYGGLPNRQGEVELDAAYMDGTTLRFGGVMGVHDIRNPIQVAMRLSEQDRNFLLCGSGAEQFARQNGFAFRHMLTEKARAKWMEKQQAGGRPDIHSYGAHDTVCVIGRDRQAHMAAGVSTSGLFMKHPGRVGDSPLIGSGLYCDGETGGAAATGIGEDIMKGCLSYEIVRRMREGASPQQACETALSGHIRTLLRKDPHPTEISVIAMDSAGRFGAATNLETFPFVYAAQGNAPAVYFAHCRNGTLTVEKATPQSLAACRED